MNIDNICNNINKTLNGFINITISLVVLCVGIPIFIALLPVGTIIALPYFYYKCSKDKSKKDK